MIRHHDFGYWKKGLDGDTRYGNLVGSGEPRMILDQTCAFEVRLPYNSGFQFTG